jgi:flagellar motor protein MotB
MPKGPLIIASILSALLIIGFVSLNAWRNGQLLEEAKTALNESRGDIEKNTLQVDELKRKLAESQARIEELQKETEASGKAQHSLEQEMRAALESKDVTISQLQGKLTVNILDRIMFDSGEAVLKGDGEAVLQKVANVLAQHPQLKIHVIGHTDNIPIRASARSRFPSNWELSTTRATAAVRFLTERGGVDPRRVGAVGYGEFRPVADNATPEGRAKNRRIAITVLSEELVGADVAPTAKANAPILPPGPAINNSQTSPPSPGTPPGGETNMPPGP